MRKYSLLVVSNDEEDFDKFNTNFQEVKDCAIQSFHSDSFETLTKWMVEALNNEEISDLNWFFLVDNENGIILHR
jgi:ethanolamine utilization cobalamin adenosyltransferase